MEDEIKSVLDALLASALAGDVSGAKTFEQTKVGQDVISAIEALDPTKVHHLLQYPLSQTMLAVVNTRFKSPQEALFLLEQYQFVEMHFNHWIRKIEGSSCSSDKSRTIVRRLMKLFKSAEPIVWDYTAEYTYHMPKSVFVDHAEIYRFFVALRELYYGNSLSYITIVQYMATKIPREN